MRKSLINIFFIFGFPKVMQSDNGKEFVNGLITELLASSKVAHHRTTPYNPQSNGVAENMVKTVKQTLMKCVQSDLSKWDDINTKVAEKHKSTPFSLMFARLENTFTDYAHDTLAHIHTDLLEQRMKHMHDVIVPAVLQATEKYQQTMTAAYDRTKHIFAADHFPIGSYVMTIPDHRASKSEPRYEGPYKIVGKSNRGTYHLIDSDDRMLTRPYAPQQLKKLSASLTFLPTTEVEEILDHKTDDDGHPLYLVKWKNFSADFNEWVRYEHFHDVAIIQQYRKDLLKPTPKKKRKSQK
jgi:hypothetical protein